jgi:hypothetical protein
MLGYECLVSDVTNGNFLFSTLREKIKGGLSDETAKPPAIASIHFSLGKKRCIKYYLAPPAGVAPVVGATSLWNVVSASPLAPMR